jgi:hypothetical protein
MMERAFLISAARRSADEITSRIIGRKRIILSEIEDLRNHVRKLASALELGLRESMNGNDEANLHYDAQQLVERETITGMTDLVSIARCAMLQERERCAVYLLSTGEAGDEVKADAIIRGAKSAHGGAK